MGTTSEGYVMRMIKNGKHETMKIKYSKYKRMRLNMLKISKQKNMGRISRTMNKTL